MRNALLKLEKSLPREYADDIRKVKQRFYFDPDPWWGQRAKIVDFESIRKAVLQSKKLCIKYAKLYEEETARIVRPYGLVVKNTVWYLVAHCEERNEPRTFRCERITELDLLDASFDIPDNFNLEEHWRASAKKFLETDWHF